MLNITNFDFSNKKALVRCDFNVPIVQGKISDDFRIKKTIPTIQYLHTHAETVILISHLGDPKGRDLSLSLRPVAEKLSQLMQTEVHFFDDPIGPILEKKLEVFNHGEIILLENLRFSPGEKTNDPNFAAQLASLGDIFVQDGFGVCHRAHASTYGVAQFLPSCTGFLLKQEIEALNKAMNNPVRPLVAILGGIKVSTKTKLIEKLLELADNVLVGGKIANSILIVKGICVRDKWTSEEDCLLKLVNKIQLTNPKLHLPIDGVIGLSNLSEEYQRIGAVGTVKKDEDIFDIGPETIEQYKNIIKEAKTIIWNGPLGYYEDDDYRKGTQEIMKAVANSGAYSILGGGDTVDIVHQLKMDDKFSYISTGGGAMLDYIAGEEMPGLKALQAKTF